MSAGVFGDVDSEIKEIEGNTGSKLRSVERNASEVGQKLKFVVRMQRLSSQIKGTMTVTLRGMPCLMSISWTAIAP